jgi:hypothetical protein
MSPICMACSKIRPVSSSQIRVPIKHVYDHLAEWREKAWIRCPDPGPIPGVKIIVSMVCIYCCQLAHLFFVIIAFLHCLILFTSPTGIVIIPWYFYPLSIGIVIHCYIGVVVIVDITILSLFFLTYDILGHYDNIVTLEILRCPEAHVVDSVEAQNDTSKPLDSKRNTTFFLKQILGFRV